jgi:RNA polymerase sigma-70 factor (ECF subfamily)
MPERHDWHPERYRPLLKLLARQLLLARRDRRLHRRFDSSDLVQETLQKAWENLDQCQASNEAQFVAWLKKILENEAKDRIAQAYTQQADVAREQSLEGALAEFSTMLEKCLQAGDTSPSKLAEHREFLLLLAAALDQLPEDQRDAFILRHIMGATLAKSAETLGRSETAVGRLVDHACRKLAELLPDYRPDNP